VTGRVETIKSLCDSWIGALTHPDGSHRIGGTTEQFRLLANGIVFHDLDHDELRAACLGLSTVLLVPGRMSTYIDSDHVCFWAWCGEILCILPSPCFSEDERDLQDLLALCIRAALASLGLMDRRAGNPPALVVNAEEWVIGAHRALAYLAFPLLEGVVKKHTSRFVDMRGWVVEDFVVPRVNGGMREYRARRRDRCSSLRDLLYLLYELTSEDLKHDLDEQRSHLALFAEDATMDGFDVIFDWRNSSLHGGANLTTVGGTVLNTALLVAISDLKHTYDAERTETLRRVRFELENEISFAGSFYSASGCGFTVNEPTDAKRPLTGY
jgi:hypothetical protein